MISYEKRAAEANVKERREAQKNNKTKTVISSSFIRFFYVFFVLVFILRPALSMIPFLFIAKNQSGTGIPSYRCSDAWLRTIFCAPVAVPLMSFVCS
jgi:hypothetical protein